MLLVLNRLLQGDNHMPKTIGIYIHVPFCRSKCYYCDFISYSGKEELINDYFEALKNELKLYTTKLKDHNIATIFIGGGTPSHVDEKYITDILKVCKEEFTLSVDAEITIEANPGTLTEQKLVTYKKAGINRISMGLQAVQAHLLKELGRIHTLDEFIDNFKSSRSIGFRNISLDLIFGLPNQTIEEWDETLSMVLNLSPEHVSCYSLKIEEGTVFGDKLSAGALVPASDELDRQMYYSAINRLTKAGFIHYEISNFSKPGYISKHNTIYWKAEEYIGLGAGAHSYFNGIRYNNSEDITDYINCVKNNNLSMQNYALITPSESMSEFVILGLRFIDGINIDEFYLRYDKNIFDVFEKQIDELVYKKFIYISKGYIKLTPVGLDLANQVMMEFI